MGVGHVVSKASKCQSKPIFAPELAKLDPSGQHTAMVQVWVAHNAPVPELPHGPPPRVTRVTVLGEQQQVEVGNEPLLCESGT